jgi:outer membrane protein OmpA-like peptidoglycan-associated protein
MASIKPMLGEFELQQVQRIDTVDAQVLQQHSVPALEGDFLQGLGRRATALGLSGVLTGPDVGESLKTLREKFRAAEPVAFVADIATATQVDQVLIEAMNIRELAGKPERFEYAFRLREFIPPPRPSVEPPPPPPPPPPPSVDTGTLVVEVEVEGQPAFDFSRIRVTVEGTQQDGTALSRTLTNRQNNVWTEENFLPGQYTVTAVETNPQPLTGSVPANVQAGQTTRTLIRLRPTSNIANTFIVHFRFDRAFVEPCLRPVLRQVALHAQDHTDEKLVLVGHTDKTGSSSYNQSLSERRARAVFAFLTFGRERAAALAEWTALRQTRPAGEQPSVKDNWGVREYQQMLQDLGFYPGPINGQNTALTQEAVRAFRCQRGLPPGAIVDDEFWNALIQDYLAQDNLAVPAASFLPNCPGEILKWLGCGEEDPVKNTEAAHRPSRRVELLFVQADRLSCQVPQPDTFNLPTPSAVNSSWCLGPTTGGRHCCFVSPLLQPGTNNPQPCPTDPQGPWCRQPAEPGSIAVTGSIQRERPDGTLEPARNQPFVLITPRGEFKQSEQSNGEPTPARTDANGAFSFPDQPEGVYSLEVIAPANSPVLVRLADGTDRDSKGSIVCKALHAPPSGTASPRLDVVIINAPVLREIRLPAVVHLMTALHPATRAVRTCPATVGPPAPQATAHSEADVQAFFEGANQIWRQARVRFLLDPADIVREAYAFRTDCEVDGNEFAFVLERDAYPHVVNVFFFGDLEGSSEAGMYVLATIGGARGTVDGCAITDRFQFTVFNPPVNVDLNNDQTIQVLAHELGHFLGLALTTHPTDSGRLMQGGTNLAGDNRTLTAAEAQQARASRNAGLECVPLSLRVSGATQFGSPRSHQYVVLQNPTGVVTVDAVIPPALLAPALGTLTITGGTPGANPQQVTVSTAGTGITEIVAVYTPVSGDPIITYVTIHVVTFELRVEGALQAGGGTTFYALQDPAAVVTLSADLNPAPRCVPRNLATWLHGDETPDPLRRTLSCANVASTVVSATVAGTTRSVTINVVQFDVTETATPAAPAVTFVRFGLWDNAYDAAGDVKNNAAENDNFIGSDKRRFHLRVNDPNATGPVQVQWKTLQANRSNDDAPASQALTLVETAPGSKVFISRGIMLVTDDTDRNFATHSGFTLPAADAGLRNAGQSNHRTRRARMDGFISIDYSPAAGVQLNRTVPVFNRAVPFSTTSTDNIAAGTRILTPAAMAGTVQGVRWAIRVGSSLTIDTGASQETVTVTAVTATTFTAVFANAHNGTATPFPIAGTVDERKQVNAQVIRYVNPADPPYNAATAAYIDSQFERANQRWNQIGIQIGRSATVDRQVPAAAIDNHQFPFDPNPNNPREVALLSDLIPITPDNTLSVVFIDMRGANAFAEVDPVNPITLPDGSIVTMGERFFIFIQTTLNLNNETLAHELHHVLFNRFDAVTDRQFFTLNTSSPQALVQGTGIVLPDVRIYRRIQNRHSPDPNNDPNNDNIVNWVRRLRTGRYPASGGLGPATATTGNTLLQDF